MKDEYGIDLNIAKAPIHATKNIKIIHATSHAPVPSPDIETPKRDSKLVIIGSQNKQEFLFPSLKSLDYDAQYERSPEMNKRTQLYLD